MTDLQDRLEAFVKLGDFFQEFCEYRNFKGSHKPVENPFFEEFTEVIVHSGYRNGWFTEENIHYSLAHWATLLTRNALENWLSPYKMRNPNPREVAVIMAGNIPLVGFHDFLTVLITGHKVWVKLSSNDTLLLPYIAQQLIRMAPFFKGHIRFAEGRMTGFDAVIATGSDNTARYFEYYFSKKPHIIRKNRNAVAVLSGSETPTQLQSLGEDIFRYYGLGCRSVSKIWVPKAYNFDLFFDAIYSYHPIIDQAKYANNYDYNKAVYLMSAISLRDNGFLLLKEDASFASPIATLFYEFYEDIAHLKGLLAAQSERLQCVVANGFIEEEIPFGTSQKPNLHDYADGVDTVEFLLKIAVNI
ncbi:acyl-CoA reductase [Arenibacter sp. GZD96]|uniref:acyl-CoA reductase n=1 Tax=Aurantibrevibacter litoralis TaxID=3106030 RepID=UPI002B000997|nr:acyl-CoA reductase [Arenibacter sp. GZD-96]MEA1786375.1 acyl-CoA reductase [Arenibacter sp. GZD-96]